MSVTPLPLGPRRDADTAHESLAEGMRRQRDEALAKAWDNSQAFEQAVAELEAVTGLIVDAGDAYPPGVREVARRLTMELGGARTRLEAIRIRNGR